MEPQADDKVYEMTPKGVFFLAYDTARAENELLCQRLHFVPKSCKPERCKAAPILIGSRIQTGFQQLGQRPPHLGSGFDLGYGLPFAGEDPEWFHSTFRVLRLPPSFRCRRRIG